MTCPCGTSSRSHESTNADYRNGHRGVDSPFFIKIFQIGIVIKGLNALVELVSGSILLMFSVDKMRSLINFFRLGQWIGLDTKTFFTWFFLSHGAVKAIIILCLLRGWVWAYPLGIAVFSAFIVYQSIEILGGHHSVLYLILTLLDILVIFLTVNEWNHAKLKKGMKV